MLTPAWNTSKELGGRVFTATLRILTPSAPSSFIFFSEARISATAPSAGEQNMYLVSGSLIIGAFMIVSRSTGLRRHAWGVMVPLRNAFSATRPSVVRVIPCSCM